MEMQRCGLLTNKNEPVPLKSIEVDLQVQGHVATVTSILQYINEEKNPLEALFVFPMPSEAALCHFSAKIADQEIVAEVKEKQKAREQYDDALSSGQQAFMLEESDESTDVFRLSVGALPPNQSTTITFIYIIELSVQADHSLRFCLPAVLNPRYTPAGSGGGIVSEISNSAGVPYTLSFTAHVTSPNPITKVESRCSLDPLEFLNTEHTKAKVSLCAGHKFDRDVELFVFYQNPHQLTAIVEAGDPAAQPGTLMKEPVVMLSFYPEFPQSVMSSMTSSGEFVFVMDRSGSMACPMSNNGSNAQSRINCARDTLLLLLKSLPIGCYFNIYGFGSHYESFFPKSVQYSQETMEQAVVKVRQLDSDMGGTEILQPLEHIYTQPCIPNHPRQLFIFTDGEVANTSDVLHCVSRNAGLHRCFSFGIGEGASTALIEGLAKNSSGHAQFITGADRMQPKVMQSLQYALQPAVVEVVEVWSGVTTTSLSPSIKSLFDGQRALIYAQLNGEESQNPDAKGKLTLQYRIGDKEVTNTVEFPLKPTENNGLTIHRLGARSLIRSLERQEKDEGADKDALKARVVELSTQSGVSSSHTAFIAVHKGSGKPVEGALVTRRVPTAGVFMCAPSGIQLMSPGFHAMSAHAMPPRSVPLMMCCSAQAPLMRKTKAKCSMPSKERRAVNKSSRICADSVCDNDDNDESPTAATDTLLQLVSVQKASGCWEMESTLAQVLGKNEEELLKLIPQQVDSGVWATLLALIWLHGFKMDAQIEWKFVAMKAVTWIRNQNVGNLAECVRVGNSLLGCQVKEDSLGI